MTIAPVGNRVEWSSAKANEIIAEVNANTARSTAPRELAYSEIVAASATFTATITDIAGLSISFILAATRTVRVDVFTLVQSNIASDQLQVTLADGASVALQVTGALFIPTVNATVPGVLSYRKSLVAGSYTFKVRANRAVGTGNGLINAAAARPAFIQALDVT